MKTAKAVDIKSPFTGGKVKEVSTIEEVEFRKEKYTVHVRYYVCEDTGEQFTTTEQDSLQFNDLYAQYRVKHGIPFPDEIRKIRLQYGLNYAQISKILGFGVNQYAQYENGQVPSESNGKMIAAAQEKRVMQGLLEACKSSFSEREYQKILRNVSQVGEGDVTAPLHYILFRRAPRSLFNGFGRQSVEKLGAMIKYIVSREKKIYPTKLNKILFYSDFYHYKNYGISISGLEYQALPYGPVPVHYDTIYDNIDGLEKTAEIAHNRVAIQFSCKKDSYEESLESAERESINKVLAVLSPLSVSRLVEESHKEPAWKKYKADNALIPYSEAFDLLLL